MALLSDSDVVVEHQGDPSRSHAERLPRAVADVLAEAGLTPAALDLLAVATGPGAFTGLRVGLASVQGLAMALDRPTVGVSSLAAAAWRYFEEHPAGAQCGVWLDGARGDVFAAAFGRSREPEPSWPLVTVAAATVDTPVATAAAWRAVVPADAPILLGSGAPGRHAAGAAGRVVLDASAPLAAAVGRIAGLAHAAGGSGPPHALAPFYVRRPDAEVERDRRLGLGPHAR